MLEESIQSKRQEIWWQLYGKLDLNPGAVVGGGRGRVLMAIRPTISVDDLLRTPTIKRAVEQLVVGSVVFCTVPDGERWRLLVYQAVVGGGDRDITFLKVSNGEAAPLTVTLDEYAATASRQFYFPQSLWILPGWELALQGSGGTTDGNWTMNIYVEVEQVSTD